MAAQESSSGIRQRLRLSGGTELSFITAGEESRPAVLLLHGTPNSARMFRKLIPALSQDAYVVAPDLPGCGESDVLPGVSFPAIGQAITELLEHPSDKKAQPLQHSGRPEPLSVHPLAKGALILLC